MQGHGEVKRTKPERYTLAEGVGHNCSVEATVIDGVKYDACTCGIDKDGNKVGCGVLYFIRPGEDRTRFAAFCVNRTPTDYTPSGTQRYYMCKCHLSARDKKAKKHPLIGKLKDFQHASKTNELPPPPVETIIMTTTKGSRMSPTEKARLKIKNLLDNRVRDSVMSLIDDYVNCLQAEKGFIMASQEEAASIDVRKASMLAKTRAIREREVVDDAALQQAKTETMQALEAQNDRVMALESVDTAVNDIKVLASKYTGDTIPNETELTGAFCRGSSKKPSLAGLVWDVLCKLRVGSGASNKKTYTPTFYLLYSVLHAANQKVNTLYLDLALAGSFNTR